MQFSSGQNQTASDADCVGAVLLLLLLLTVCWKMGVS
jgi:hypothetical protein